MSPEILGQTGEAGQFGKWDVYPLFVQEAGRLADRRQIANTLFLSINSVLVGAIAVLAQQSGLASVKLLILEIVIAVAGFLLSRQWLKLLKLYSRLLNYRFEKLALIEAMPGFPGALPMYTLERSEGRDLGSNKDKSIFGFGRTEEFIPKLFLWLYSLGPLLLIAGTFAVKLNFSGWLTQYISLPVLH
jgi:hypothetical protein